LVPLDNRAVIVVLAIAAATLALATFVISARDRDDRAQALLAAAAPWLPGGLAVTIVALFLSGQPAAYAITTGVLATSVAWLCVGLAFRRAATVESANPRNFGSLRDRRARLAADLDVAGDPSTWAASSPDQRALAQMACTEAQGHLESISLGLGIPPARPTGGAIWLTGTGYIDLWNRMHRAEEAVITVAPLPGLLASAFHDRLRLTGSNIGNSTDLIDRLDLSVQTLTSTSATELEKSRARADLRMIRYAINSYRDDLWDGLVRSRNRLLKTMVFTGLTANVALVLALIAGADTKVIIGASAFYLVGAIVGLFNRMRSEAETTGVVDDYGLTEARMIVTPLASGLGAVAGVVLAAKFLLPAGDVVRPETAVNTTPPAATQTAAPQSALPQPAPAQATASAAVTVAPEPSSLSEIFDLGTNPGGLVVAAIFGLTPGLLIDRLQGQAEKSKSNLSASGATDSKPK